MRTFHFSFDLTAEELAELPKLEDNAGVFVAGGPRLKLLWAMAVKGILQSYYDRNNKVRFYLSLIGRRILFQLQEEKTSEESAKKRILRGVTDLETGYTNNQRPFPPPLKQLAGEIREQATRGKTSVSNIMAKYGALLYKEQELRLYGKTTDGKNRKILKNSAENQKVEEYFMEALDRYPHTLEHLGDNPLTPIPTPPTNTTNTTNTKEHPPNKKPKIRKNPREHPEG